MSQTYQYADGLMKSAAKIVGGDRKADYGDALYSFRSIAALWNAYLNARCLITEELQASDVAMLMDLLKTSRFATGGYKEDTFIDKAGYSALGGAIARIEHENASQPSQGLCTTCIHPDED